MNLNHGNPIFSHQDVRHHKYNSRHVSGNSNDFEQHDSQNQTACQQTFEDSEPHKGQYDTINGALISIPSSSSSSSSVSLFSESSFDREWNLLLNKRQHTVSCSNLPEAWSFQDEASGKMDFELSDSALFIRQHQQKQEKHFGSQQHVSELGLKKSPLYRCQSKSVVGLLQSRTQEHSIREHERLHSLEYNQLYKTTSLGQTRAVTDKAAATVNMAKPKRAVSSIQLPSKGNLKNKDERQKHRNLQKSRSMEALSTKGQHAGPHKQRIVEALRDNFIKEKIEFSAFLDEISRQVISPSRLSSFRINPIITQTSYKSPEENRKNHAKASNHEAVDVQKSSNQQNVMPIKPENKKGRADISKQNHQTRNFSGEPRQPQHQRSQENQQSAAQSYRTTSYKKHLGKHSQFHNNGTITIPESILPEQHYQAEGKQHYNDGYGISTDLNTKHKISSLPAGLDMEYTKKSFKVTTPNLENMNKHRYKSYRRHSKQSHRGSVSSMDRALFLEHYNKDLQENLLQTMSCIKNVEAELQRIKTELSSVKDKCKKLEKHYTSCQQATNVLEQQVQSVIPSDIKQLWDNHIDSEDDVKNFLLSSASCSQLDINKSAGTLGFRNKQ